MDSYGGRCAVCGLRPLGGSDWGGLCAEGGAVEGKGQPLVVVLYVWNDVEFTAALPAGVGLVVVQEDTDFPREDGAPYTVRARGRARNYRAAWRLWRGLRWLGRRPAPIARGGGRGWSLWWMIW